MLKLRVVSALVAAALLCSLAPALAQAQTATGGRPAVGVQVHALWDYGSDRTLLGAALDKMAAGGLKWVRYDISWCSLQEQGRDKYSQWYVDRLEWAVDAARARGLEVLGAIVCTPGWANGHEDDGWAVAAPIPPTDPADLGRTGQWLAARFKGRVAAWQIWNEPNVPHFFSGTAADYAHMLKGAYPGFKAGDPGAEVVLGGPAAVDIPWLTKVYEAGAQGSFDVMAAHPYMGTRPPETVDGSIWSIAKVADLHTLMTAMGDGGKPIWFTEYGWSAHSGGVTLEQQADYLVRSIKYIGENFPYVTNVFWYNERNKSTNNAGEDNLGLLNRDLSAKPAYTALKDFLATSGEVSPTPAPTTEPSPSPTTDPAPAPDPDDSDASTDTVRSKRRGFPSYGVQVHAMWDYGNDQQLLGRVLDKVAASGMDWIRLDVSWCSLQERSRSEYSSWYVDRLDWTVRAARQRGLKVLGAILCTPGWANGLESRGWDVASPVPPDDPADFRNAAKWLGQHFRGRVQAWQVWNEPNVDHFFSAGPAAYARILRAGYKGFKAGDASAKVVFGGPASIDVNWIRKAYAAGAKGHFDVMAAHPYMGTRPPETVDGSPWSIAAVADLHRLMKARGDGHKKIWFTEYGWSSHSGGVTATQQADYLVRSIKYVDRKFPYVTNMFWYNERDKSTGSAGEDNLGLLERDLSPKPAYKRLRSFLNGGVPNLIRNGGFENGRRGWSASSGRIRTVRGGKSGQYSGKLTAFSRRGKLRAAPVSKARGRRVVQATAFVRSPNEGRIVRLTITERTRRRVVGWRSVTTRITADGWSKLQVRYRTGRAKSRLKFKISVQKGARRVFVDNASVIRL